MAAPAGGYEDMSRGGNGYNSYREPKLGAYAPGSTWQDPDSVNKSSKKKWIVSFHPC